MAKHAAALLLVLVTLLLLPTRAAAQVMRNTLNYFNDPFVVSSTSEDPQWVKFAIVLSDPGTVVFQQSNQFRFHYDFATLHLPPFVGTTRAQFDAGTLHINGQQAVLGAVLFPPFESSGAANEFAVQIVGQDVYPREFVRGVFNTVKTKVIGNPAAIPLYMPTFEQQALAESEATWFQSQGITVASAGRWARGNAVYAPGWALGRLKFVTASQIAAAYGAGTLLPTDILLTDGVPAEVPYVAGIVSLSPGIPSSHVAILSASYGVPFTYLASASDAARAQALAGRRVLLRAYSVFGRGTVTLVDTTDTLTQPQVDELLALNSPPTLDITPMAHRGAYSLNTDPLTPADSRYVGGKAAHYGILRRAIQSNVRPGAALTFDLWNAYMQQTLTNGRTLRQEIHARLDQHTWPPANMAALRADLEAVRTLFTSTSTTAFSPPLQAAVLSTLQDPQYNFQPGVKIRFRSSTNVEDADDFTGAGLYDSFSGCLADELDADTVGPSICDPTEANERGVFRAIRRVYASFYNENAFIQRRRFNINEDQVGMAVLVHHSFPDETEMANGVAVLTRSGPNTFEIQLTTQLGATSITNPEDGSTPEQVEVWAFSGSMFPTLVRSSDRVQLGATVMEWDTDYRALANLLITSSNRYTTETGLQGHSLDFEFKKTTFGGALEIKQMRPLPRPVTTPSIVPYLVPEETEYCMFQGERGDVFANHRLKQRTTVQTRFARLTTPHTQTLFTTATQVLHDRCDLPVIEGAFSSLPAFQWSTANSQTTDRWSTPGLSNPRTTSLTVTNIPALVAPVSSPVLTIRDLGGPGNGTNTLQLDATYQTPVPSIDWLGNLQMVTSEVAFLCPCELLKPVILTTRDIALPNNVRVVTSFYWGAPPVGIVAGYTAHLAAWEQTVITGLTGQPIVLTGEYSQTYRPGHHNFTESFIFEPRLDPSVPSSQLAELRDLGIAAMYVEGPTYTVTYFDEFGATCPTPCFGDFNGDGDFGTDQDIEAFFACLAGNCCPRCGRADFNGDGDFGTDQDIEAFFRVLSGAPC